MTLTVSTSADPQPMELAEYTAFVREALDLRDLDAVRESGEQLARLARNRQFLGEAVAKALSKHDWRATGRRLYGQESIILDSKPPGPEGRSFFIRANTWRPTVPDDEQRSDEAWLRGPYDHYHNHNFALLTAGYAGAGYRTRIYHCRPEAIVGHVDEPVELEFIEDTWLTPGKVMFYRPHEHIHCQFQPPEESISLNLMVASSTDVARNQLLFDEANGRIHTLQGLGPASRGFLRSAMALLDEKEVLAEPLQRLAEGHPAPEQRDFALEMLARIYPDEAETIWSMGLRDASPRVRYLARAALEDRLPQER